jgi:hypothetical protein
MRDLVIHAGRQKTGSTYLQAVLAANHARLERAGLGMAPYWNPVNGAHGDFLDALVREGEERVLAAAAQVPGETVLVSNEDLGGFLLQPATGGRAAEALLRAARRQDFRVRVLYWVRRQDFLAESHFSQGVRTWYSGPATAYPTQDYDYDHDGNLRRLEAVFGRDNVSAFLYRDDAANDLAGDLLAALGLAGLRPELALDLGRRNASPPRRKTLLLSHVPKSWRRRKARPKAAEVCRAIVRAVAASDAVADDGMRFMLPPAARRDLVARHLAGNRALVARHRIADPGSFVALPAPDPGWRPPAPIRAGELAAVLRAAAALLWAEHHGAASLVDWQPRLAAVFLRVAARARTARAA